MADLDERLVEAVDRLPRSAFAGRVFRHLGPGQSVTSGEGARIRGGRWNPPDSFAVLYLGLTRGTVKAEFYRLADREEMPPENLLPRRLQEYRVELQSVLDLRDSDVRSMLGLSDAVLAGDEPTLCQAIGDAAHYAGFEDLVAPSATGSGEILAVFTDRLMAGSHVSPGASTMWETLP